jgi:hypothetical protein
MGINIDITMVPIPPIPPNGGLADALAQTATAVTPLRKLLPGKWVGSGFNLIFRPLVNQTDPDNPVAGAETFLELNLTHDTLEFTAIPGDIPNRGLFQRDITLHGVTYLQQISDANVKQNGKPAGIHIEPGLWIDVEATTEPQVPASVARLATIPHGTALTAVGTATTEAAQPAIPSAALDPTPFLIGNPQSLVTLFHQLMTLGDAQTQPRRSPVSDTAGLNPKIVFDPRIVLREFIKGKQFRGSTTRLQVSTASGGNPAPIPGGGVSDIGFLDGTPEPANAPKPDNDENARVAAMDATFWISTFVTGNPPKTTHLLQYEQLVLLNFNSLSWPHITVGNLLRQ